MIIQITKGYVLMSGKARKCIRLTSHISVFSVCVIHLPSTTPLKLLEGSSFTQKDAVNMKALEDHLASKQNRYVSLQFVTHSCEPSYKHTIAQKR
jgi:hypothetical protein